MNDSRTIHTLFVFTFSEKASASESLTDRKKEKKLNKSAECVSEMSLCNVYLSSKSTLYGYGTLNHIKLNAKCYVSRQELITNDFHLKTRVEPTKTNEEKELEYTVHTSRRVLFCALLPKKLYAHMHTDLHRQIHQIQ